MKKLLPAIALLVFLPWFEANAEVVYKWTDEHGSIHFSDRPQDGSEAIALPGSPRYSSGRSETPKTSANAGSQPGSNADQSDEQQTLDKAKHEEVRRKNCEIARQTLERNQNMGRMYRIGADGERHFLSDEERSAVLKSSRDDVAHWCD